MSHSAHHDVPFCRGEQQAYDQVDDLPALFDDEPANHTFQVVMRPRGAVIEERAFDGSLVDTY